MTLSLSHSHSLSLCLSVCLSLSLFTQELAGGVGRSQQAMEADAATTRCVMTHVSAAHSVDRLTGADGDHKKNTHTHTHTHTDFPMLL